MITGTSTQFDAIITGDDITGGTWRVQMTLPAGTYSDVSLSVESVDIDASTTSDMPEDTRLEVGYPAMQATVTLSGLVDSTDELKTARWLFSPYPIQASDGSVSPMYQRDPLYSPVTIDLGLHTDAAAGTTTQGTPEWVRKFTGYVDTCVVNEDGSVQFTCLESMRQQLRGEATLPPLFNTTVTTEYLIDSLLRSDTAAAVSSWPKQIPQCLLAVGFRAAPLPEAGSLLADYSSTYAPGVFGSALAGGQLKPAVRVADGGPNFGQFTAAEYLLPRPYAAGGNQVGGYPNQAFSSQYVYVEFWVDGDVSTVFPSVALASRAGVDFAGWAASYHKLTIKQTGLEVSSTLYATQVWATTVAPGPHYIGWWMKIDAGAGTVAITVVLDGTMHTFTTLSGVSPLGTPRNYVAVGWSAASPASTIEALQVSSDIAGYVLPSGGLGVIDSFGFVPRAVLDPSLNSTLRVVNQVTGDTYSVIQQLTDAELAVAGGDEAGTFRFHNRTNLRSAASARSITSAASLVGVGGIQTAAASVKNHCTVDWSGWELSDTASVIYQAASPIRIPARQTVVLTPTLDNPGVLYGNVSSAGVSRLPDGGTAAGFWLRASTTKAGAKEFPDYNKLTRTIRQTAADKLEITLVNKTSTDAWLVSPANYLDVTAGTPMLRISGNVWGQTAGTVDVQYPFAADGGSAKSRFGDQPHSITGNPWIQDAGTAFRLATDVVSDLCNPRPNLTGVEIVPDPRLQLTDVVRIQDPDWTGVDEYARIFGWKLSWSPSDYMMTLDARTLAPPGGWIMGVSGRSEIGSTAYVYSSV